MFEDIRQAAISVTSKVFETMFFTSLELLEENPVEEGLSEKPSSVFKGEIEFQGKLTGKMSLYLPSELAKTMAFNFMGLEEETASESQTMDMVNELCNMICGNFVSQLDKKAVCDLSLPHTLLMSSLEMGEKNNEPGINVDFNAEGHRMRLIIQFETKG